MAKIPMDMATKRFYVEAVDWWCRPIDWCMSRELTIRLVHSAVDWCFFRELSNRLVLMISRLIDAEGCRTSSGQTKTLWENDLGPEKYHFSLPNQHEHV